MQGAKDPPLKGEARLDAQGDVGLSVDILIVGAGLVGLSLAAALQGSGLRIMCVDAQTAPTPPEQRFEARALVLNAGSVDYLRALGVWSSELAVDATPLKTVHLSKQGALIRTRFRAADYGVEALGQVLAADRLVYALYETVQRVMPGACHYQRTILDLKRSAAGWTFSFDDASRVETRLLVAADGTDSRVRRAVGIGVEVIEDAQWALMFNIGLAQDHQGVAYERWTADGSLALLPFGAQRMKGVWIMPQTRAQILSNLSEQAFLTALQACAGYALGIFKSLSAVQAMPLRRLRATTLYDHHLVLIGNAANTLHPIAAQGFNRGLRDVKALAQCLAAARTADLAAGAISLLQAYAALRANDHLQTQAWTECLARTPGFQALGLCLAEGCPPFKQWIFQQHAV